MFVALQRSKSAPQPIASLVQPVRSARDDERHTLARTVSHEYVHRPQTYPYTKPLVSTSRLATSPMNTDEGDPFNLLTFFPAGLQGRRGDWQWFREEALAEEEEEEVVNEAEARESPVIFVATEDKHASEVIKGEDKLGILSIGGYESYFNEDSGLMSPYKFDDVVDEESLYEVYCRRRKAAGELPAADVGYSELFFGIRG